MTERTLTDIVADLRQSQQDFLEIMDQANEEVLYHRPAEDSWTLAEALVHMAEARQFFTGETQKVLATSDRKVGRTVEDRGRLQNIEDHGHDSLAEIRHKFITSHENMVKTLGDMTDNDLQIEVEHVKYGSQTLAEFIQRFMVGHDRVHVQQATALLAGESASE